jgi:hypothetical protein
VEAIVRFLALVLLLLVAISASAAESPSPERSEYLLSRGAGFLMKIGSPDFGARYGMTFEVIKRRRSSLYALVSFENPEDPEAPFVVEEFIARTQKEITPQSPPFFEARNNHVYTVTVELFSDAKHTQKVGEHRQGVLMSVDEELLPRLSVRLK